MKFVNALSIIDTGITCAFRRTSWGPKEQLFCYAGSIDFCINDESSEWDPHVEDLLANDWVRC